MVTKENIRSYGKPSRFDTLPEQTKRALALNKPVPANQNLTRMQRAKEAVAKGMTRAAGPVGAAVRGGLRVAGPVGALVGMTTPAGAGSDKPSGSLMRGGMQPNKIYVTKPDTNKQVVNRSGQGSLPSGVSAKPTGPSRGPTSAPVRTAPSSGVRPTSPSTPARSTGPSRGPTSAPVRTAPSKPAASAAKSTGPSRGPTSAPVRTQPSKANLGTSRFSKGGSVKRRKK